VFGAPRASDNFYRNVFALLTFLIFVCALALDSPAAFALTLVTGTVSRVAVKRGWKNPDFAGRMPFFARSKGAADDD
jgi:hypothetical protein